jgi:hypothetical protein
MAKAASRATHVMGHVKDAGHSTRLAARLVLLFGYYAVRVLGVVRQGASHRVIHGEGSTRSYSARG